MSRHIVVAVIGMMAPIALLVLFFNDPFHRWARWAKRVSIALCGLGLIWGALVLALYYHPMRRRRIIIFSIA